MHWEHCCECGKDFICNNPEPYVYVINYKGVKRFYCCYTCFRKAQKQLELELEQNKQRRKSHERK